MYKIKFQIGDWSDDGHNQCEDFVILSNKPVEELRELHYSCVDKLGFDIGDIASDFEEPWVPESIYDTLIGAGVDMSKEVQEEGENYVVQGPEAMLRLWLKIYQFLDPTFTYTIPHDGEVIPTIQFYGFDEKNRHLRTPGYGLFTL